jgi:hypothetical protein
MFLPTFSSQTLDLFGFEGAKMKNRKAAQGQPKKPENGNRPRKLAFVGLCYAENGTKGYYCGGEDQDGADGGRGVCLNSW